MHLRQANLFRWILIYLCSLLFQLTWLSEGCRPFLCAAGPTHSQPRALSPVLLVFLMCPPDHSPFLLHEFLPLHWNSLSSIWIFLTLAKKGELLKCLLHYKALSILKISVMREFILNVINWIHLMELRLGTQNKCCSIDSASTETGTSSAHDFIYLGKEQVCKRTWSASDVKYGEKTFWVWLRGNITVNKTR